MNAEVMVGVEESCCGLLVVAAFVFLVQVVGCHMYNGFNHMDSSCCCCSRNGCANIHSAISPSQLQVPPQQHHSNIKAATR
ncbi:unnamed protein product [Lathyrus oleraceus]